MALARSRRPGARLGGPRRIAALVREVQRLKADLLAAGGATIDTPDPPAGATDAFPLAARTVVQPDGDFLFFVGDAYFVDAGMRELHAARVADWFAALQARVKAAAATLRWAAITLMSAILLTTGQAFRDGATSGFRALVISAGAGVVVQSAIRLAVSQGIRRYGRSR